MMLRFRWPASELHADIGRPVTATNAYDLLTPERELKATLEKLIFIGDEFQNAITASHDGTSDFTVIDRLRGCLLMLVVYDCTKSCSSFRLLLINVCLAKYS